MSIKFTYKKAFSLLELLVSLVVTSLIVISITLLYTSATRQFGQVTSSGEIQNDSEILFSTIEADIARGGFVHPLRGHVMTDGAPSSNCLDDTLEGDSAAFSLTSDYAVRILNGGDGVSACFDIPNFEETLVYRYKTTYQKGNGSTDRPNENTLYKKVIRTDDCGDTDMTNTVDPNYASIAHGWQPVSSNIDAIVFSYPTIGDTVKTDIIDIDISFLSQKSDGVRLNFKKNIFLRNKLLASNSTNCKDYCPNSKSIFRNYNISGNNSYYNPALSSNTIPRVRVVISDNYVNGEDTLEWSAAEATRLNITANFDATKGLLIANAASAIGADDMQAFIRTIRYVNKQQTIEDRTRTASNPDRKITMVLGFGDLCGPLWHLMGRVDGNDVTHFYCYVHDVTSGRYDGNLWWSQAQLRAKDSLYYNLQGYLATITSQEEQIYAVDKITNDAGTPPAAWLGGSDVRSEGQWLWMDGPENGIEFRVSDGDAYDSSPTLESFNTLQNGSSVRVWRDNEPNDCCDGNNWVGSDGDDTSVPSTGAWEADEFLPTVSNLADANGDSKYEERIADNSGAYNRGEHYLQFSKVTAGRWNDLNLRGTKGAGTYSTSGYILEFSTDWTGATSTCPGGTAPADATDAQRYACVNYNETFEITLDDYAYTASAMLDFCDITPGDPGV